MDLQEKKTKSIPSGQFPSWQGSKSFARCLRLLHGMGRGGGILLQLHLQLRLLSVHATASLRLRVRIPGSARAAQTG
uniref:Uncharacterized protein n=1 Tax=Arundo donax TaxID=35708 RepID=A0A0A9DA19_ARUDO